MQLLDASRKLCTRKKPEVRCINVSIQQNTYCVIHLCDRINDRVFKRRTQSRSRIYIYTVRRVNSRDRIMRAVSLKRFDDSSRFPEFADHIRRNLLLRPRTKYRNYFTTPSLGEQTLGTIDKRRSRERSRRNIKNSDIGRHF